MCLLTHSNQLRRSMPDQLVLSSCSKLDDTEFRNPFDRAYVRLVEDRDGGRGGALIICSMRVLRRLALRLGSSAHPLCGSRSPQYALRPLTSCNLHRCAAAAGGGYGGGGYGGDRRRSRSRCDTAAR